MAMQRRIPVRTTDVFPEGAYLVGPIEAVMDFNADKRPDGSRPQQVDPETGLLAWAAPVLDADPAARKADKTVTVKFFAKVQPVPPENKSETPFTPVQFVNLTATPYIAETGGRPRLAWSYRADGFAGTMPAKAVA